MAEFNIRNFKFWCEALEVVKRLKEEDLLEEAETLIETAFETETPTDDQINDYVSFYLEDDLLEIYDKALWPKND
jgi:hypothetical protein